MMGNIEDQRKNTHDIFDKNALKVHEDGQLL